MAYFKVGDCVTVIDDLMEFDDYKSDDGACSMVAIGEMLEYCSKKLHITSVGHDGRYDVREIGAWWTDEMFKEYVYKDDVSINVSNFTIDDVIQF